MNTKNYCTRCRKPAVKQTVRGKDGGRNEGWYCQKHWDEGVAIENEAMYGN